MGTTPVADGSGHELGPIVAAQVLRDATQFAAFVQSMRDVIGGDRATEATHHVLSGELVAHRQRLDGAAVGGGIEDEVQRPHVVGALR
jgi:hypothetical protein